MGIEEFINEGDIDIFSAKLSYKLGDLKGYIEKNEFVKAISIPLNEEYKKAKNSLLTKKINVVNSYLRKYREVVMLEELLLEGEKKYSSTKDRISYLEELKKDFKIAAKFNRIEFIPTINTIIEKLSEKKDKKDSWSNAKKVFLLHEIEFVRYLESKGLGKKQTAKILSVLLDNSIQSNQDLLSGINNPKSRLYRSESMVNDVEAFLKNLPFYK